MKRIIFSFTTLFGILILISSCNKNEEDYVLAFDDTEFETTDWTDASHAKSADPDFNEVFDDNAVKRLDFVISKERWEGMLTDMENTYGSFGSGGGSGLLETDENPIFVPGDVYYNGKQWYKVGLRFKGNSSLQSSWGSGILKLSFKMDFDEFEDEYPQIDNQRFYGFKKFSLKNNYNDASQLREKVGGDLFRNAGLAAPHTAFYTLYVDHGDGPEYFGLYTLVEEVDNTVIKTQFSDDNGNLYKPDGTGASFADGTFSEDVFEKKTNEDEADWTDIKDLFSVLHDDSRTTNPTTWRSDLETIFDTETFLKYLAVNTVIQNWDTYGIMTHNYFLYNNPDNNLLTWIPWDNNEALQTGKRSGAHALNFSGLSSSDWPLIGFLYSDDVYKATYDAYVLEIAIDVFNASAMESLYTSYAALIEPYATTERDGFTFLNGAASFQSAITTLKNHAVSRTAAVNDYL
ncbi:MAG: CotH kinase family protein [Saprospiraceae bacterium]